eukprot:SAG31_NODE_1006_length_10432_cov_3.272718_3_plen_182_part_00
MCFGITVLLCLQGGDFKYIKEADLIEMQEVSTSDVREVASVLGHELSFKEIREKAANAEKGRRTGEGSFDFITFVCFMAFKSGFDCAFVLAYSIIMLNTDLHNEKLGDQKRLTKKEFIANNRRSPDLATLSDEYLGGIYDEILNEEFKMFDEGEESAMAQRTNNFFDVSTEESNLLRHAKR